MRVNHLVSILVALAVVLPSTASAALTVTPTEQWASLAPGSTWNATGTITNLTGFDLQTTDIFLNFSGYPFAALTPSQTLGGLDSPINDRTIFGPADLFSVMLSSATAPGESYSFEMFAVDANGNFSNINTFTLLVAAPVPEPPAPFLMACGLLALLLLRAGGNRLPSGHARGQLPRRPAFQHNLIGG